MIKKGSVINMNPSQYARGRIIKQYRSDETVVDTNGMLLVDCVFPSVSAAARFVTGRSENGFIAWKVGGELTLDEWLYNAGMRNKKTRTKGAEL